jgi:hypothetical protein
VIRTGRAGYVYAARKARREREKGTPYQHYISIVWADAMVWTAALMYLHVLVCLELLILGGSVADGHDARCHCDYTL